MDIQREILKEVAEIFKEEYIPAVLREKNDEEGIPMDILSLLYTEYGDGDNEVSVDLFFLPVAAASRDNQYFALVINISDSVSGEYREELIKAVNVLNFIAPVGSYVLSPDGSALFYKLVTPLPAKLNKEQLLTQVNLTVANALDLAEAYVGLLQKFVIGKASLDDVIGLL